ncbi:hypothetical protein EH206_14120 [Brenneria nigrifluens DSM 30175 = ATCC 13028]|uniref:Transposase n=1 Tax=Brenneria nigrifluens DSM 30175 = ATCC 13028 TaxID=1121120 RepID=A0ABX5V4P7_9GAMM|nr:hypothetical protein EH206_14120 [Brenneria nigrifluens DSM 30175 = ATCC 13028]
MSGRDAAKASAAPDKNAGSVFEQHLCWPVRASPMDGTSIPRQWRPDQRSRTPKASRSDDTILQRKMEQRLRWPVG